MDFKDENLEERKSIIDVFMEYRHYKLEDIEDKNQEQENIDREEVNSDEDDEYLTINLNNSSIITTIDEELNKEDD